MGENTRRPRSFLIVCMEMRRLTHSYTNSLNSVHSEFTGFALLTPEIDFNATASG